MIYQNASRLFWSTPKENLNKETFVSFVFLFILAMLVFAPLAAGGTIEQIFQGQQNNLFLFMFAIVAFIITYVKSEITPSVGESRNFSISLALGFALGALSVFSAGPTQGISTSTLLSIIYITVFVPWIEEQFYSKAVPAMISMFSANFHVIAVITSLIFGFIQHFYSYGAASNSIIVFFSLFMFRMIILYGNRYFKSMGFGYGLHYGQNFFNTVLMILSKALVIG